MPAADRDRSYYRPADYFHHKGHEGRQREKPLMAASFVVVQARCFTAKTVQHDTFSATEPIGGRAAAPTMPVLEKTYGR